MAMTRRAPAKRRAAGRATPRHAHAAAATVRARCAVITVSDTRGPREDASGEAIASLLVRAGHLLLHRAWVPDEPAAIRRAVRAALRDPGTDAVILTGGTGIAPRDRTPEAIARLLDRELPGFGEAFRALSFRQVGAAAWLSRAVAGVADGRLVVALPGSTRAVTLAVSKLLIPELGHIARLLGRS